MRDFDLSPFYRSTVGFDSLMSMLDRVADFDNEATTYPPYNIERLNENEYRITMAVAGFGKEDVEIEVKENTLSIRGEKKEADQERTFLHRGIASRAFERRFQLADHVEVRGANVKDGLLSIDLKLEVPARLKPRMIEIGATVAEGKTVAEGNKTIDASVAAK
jgi:molecular chaperone IbpA